MPPAKIIAKGGHHDLVFNHINFIEPFVADSCAGICACAELPIAEICDHSTMATFLKSSHARK